jgi:lipopolysaccharide transport system permease protein
MTSNRADLWNLALCLRRHRELVRRLSGREFSARFRGSMLGVTWAVVTPILLAAVYTFVFSTVFGARWGGNANTGHFDYVIFMLTGLAVHGIFVECVTRAPNLVLANPSYVTKVVFPLEVLPFVALLSALTNAAVSLTIAVLLNLVLNRQLHATALFLPIVLAPYAIFVVAFAMVIAACGVYLRDLSQVINILIPVSLFLTPIFYPLESVPRAMRPFMWANPLTFVVEQVRAVLIVGTAPSLTGLAIYATAALGALAVSYWLFQRLRSGFADVL